MSEALKGNLTPEKAREEFDPDVKFKRQNDKAEFWMTFVLILVFAFIAFMSVV